MDPHKPELSAKILINREFSIPDPEKLELYRSNPSLGPRILFFSGGSAIRQLSTRLINYTWNSIHLITPFDSGGSSAVLREAFRMPAIGDIRNRLMALADQTVLGNPEIFRLFAYRLPTAASEDDLLNEFTSILEGRHELIAAVSSPMRKIIRHHLKLFSELKPENFNLAGANIGNLVLTAGYLENRRHLDPTIYIYSKLAEVRGVVRPVVSVDCHLGAELDNGEKIIGQHLITKYNKAKSKQRIKNIFLLDAATPASAISDEISIRPKVTQLISKASIICYPMGSFFTSLIASLLPSGIGSALAQSRAPKIYIPNTGDDPESFGLNLRDQIETLLNYLKRNNPTLDDKQLLNFVLLDNNEKNYNGKLNPAELEERGIRIIRRKLISAASQPLIDADLLTETLLSLN